jgi:hypothetical protein
MPVGCCNVDVESVQCKFHWIWDMLQTWWGVACAATVEQISFAVPTVSVASM